MNPNRSHSPTDDLLLVIGLLLQVECLSHLQWPDVRVLSAGSFYLRVLSYTFITGFTEIQQFIY